MRLQVKGCKFDLVAVWNRLLRFAGPRVPWREPEDGPISPESMANCYTQARALMARSRSKWLWLAILPGGLLLILGIVFLVLWIGFDATSYQDVLLRQLSGWAGRQVRVEDVQVGVLPPRLRLLGLEVGEAAATSDELLFTARSLDADFNLGALFGSEPAVRRFQVVEPTIYLRQNQAGKWNFQPGSDPPVSAREKQPVEGSLTLPGRDWYLQEGTVLIQRYGEDPIRLAHLEAAVTEVSATTPFPVQIQFQLGEAGSIEVEGNLGLLHAAPSLGVLVSVRVSLDDVAPQDLGLISGLSAVPASVSSLNGSLELALLEQTSRLEGLLDLQLAEGRKLAPLGDWKLDGSARFSDLRSRLAEGANPIRIGSLQVSFEEDRIETIAEAMAVAEGEFRLAVELTGFQAPHITFDLGGDRLDWTALRSHLTSPAGRSGSNLSQHQYPMTLRSARGKGDLSLVRVTRGDLELGPIRSGVVLDDGTIRLRPIQMGLHDGTATGSLVLKTARSPLSVDLQAELDNVDLNQFLAAHTSHDDKVYGQLSGSLRVQAQASEEGLVRSSQGHARVEVTEGRLRGISLNRELALLTEAVGLRVQRDDTPIELMSASVRITGGWVTTSNLIVQTPDFLFTGIGGFSFEEAIQLDAIAALLPEAVLETPGRGVLGLLSGALPVDDQNRVLLPFKVRGTFSEHRYQLDAAQLANLKLKGGFLRDLFKRPPG